MVFIISYNGLGMSFHGIGYNSTGYNGLSVTHVSYTKVLKVLILLVEVMVIPRVHKGGEYLTPHTAQETPCTK